MSFAIQFFRTQKQKNISTNNRVPHEDFFRAESGYFFALKRLNTTFSDKRI